MQIFIPVADLDKTMEVLDYKRLGKQRIEARQIINIILERTVNGKKRVGWKNHPCSLMWGPYIEFLKVYYNKCIEEWKRRGYKNTMELEPVDESKVIIPSWWGDEEVHSCHRGNLLRKDKEFYEKLGWTDPIKDGYLWVHDGKRYFKPSALSVPKKPRVKKTEEEKAAARKRPRKVKTEEEELAALQKQALRFLIEMDREDQARIKSEESSTATTSLPPSSSSLDNDDYVRPVLTLADSTGLIADVVDKFTLSSSPSSTPMSRRRKRQALTSSRGN